MHLDSCGNVVPDEVDWETCDPPTMVDDDGDLVMSDASDLVMSDDDGLAVSQDGDLVMSDDEMSAGASSPSSGLGMSMGNQMDGWCDDVHIKVFAEPPWLVEARA